MRLLGVGLLGTFFAGVAGCAPRTDDVYVTLAFSPTGKLLAGGGGRWEESGKVTVWNCSDWVPRAHLTEELKDQVQFVKFISDNELASASGKRRARGHPDDGVELVFWDTTDKAVKSRTHIPNCRGFARCLDFLPSSDLVAFSQWKPLATCGVYRLSNLEKRLDLGTDQRYASIHRFAPDGKTLLSCNGPDLSLFEVATGKCVATLTLEGASAAECVSFSHDGQRIALSCADSVVRVLPKDLGAPPQAIKVDSSPTCLFFTPDGDGLGVADGTSVKIFSVDRGVLTKSHSGGVGPVTSFAFSPDGGRLAIAGKCVIRVIDVKSGEHLAELR